MIIRKILAAGAFLALFAPLPAFAQEWYVGGSVGALSQSDSNNTGVTGAFKTGNGSPTVPNQTNVAAGTNYGWKTQFGSGSSASVEAGLRYGNGVRSGVEIAYSSADIDRHSGVKLGGTVIDSVDAAVLTGSATKLGATVGQVVADGRGGVDNLSVFANVYYDFNLAGPFAPYVGAGVGFTKVDVDYSPSGVGIINDNDTVFAWQLKAGATYKLSDNWEVYGEYAYRKSADPSFSNKLFPGSLDVENQQSVVSLGVRFRFS